MISMGSPGSHLWSLAHGAVQPGRAGQPYAGRDAVQAEKQQAPLEPLWQGVQAASPHCLSTVPNSVVPRSAG